MDWVLDAVFDWLARRMIDLLTWLLGLMTASFFSSPDVTGFPQVIAVVQRSATVVAAVFVLAIVTAGALVMARAGFQVQYEAKDLLPRLAVGLTASTFGLGACHGLIEVFNAVATAMVGRTAAGPRSVEFVRSMLRLAGIDPALRAFMTVDALIIVVLFLQLLMSMVTRTMILLVLAGVAPVALACHALSQTQAVAALWWRSLLGVLVTPVLQGIAFSAAVDLVLNPDHNLRGMLGMGGTVEARAVAVLNLFLLTCLLLITVRIPRLVARFTLTGRTGSNPVGVVVRAVVVQTLLRRLPVPGLGRLAR